MILKLKKENGFTLIEVMVVFLIAIFIFAGAVELYRSSVTTNNTYYTNLNSQGEIRNSFKTMTAGIRSASQSSLGAYPIDTAGTSSFIYYSDIDGDNLKERIRYYLSGSTLKQGIIKPTGLPLVYSITNEKISPLITSLTNTSTPIFQYYDGDYDGSGAPLDYPMSIPDIRLIKITASINQSPDKIPAVIMEFITQVSIRNLKDNF